MDLANIIDLNSLTAEERINVETVRLWGELYNSDVTRMVTECYDPECTVDVKGFMQYHGHAPFIALEQRVHSVAPQRRGIPERIIAKGDVVIVQASLVNPDMGPDWKSPFCVVLTLRNGKILRDETYLDMTSWPSPLMEPKEFKALGLEAKRSFLELALVAVPGLLVRKVKTVRTILTSRMGT